MPEFLRLETPQKALRTFLDSLPETLSPQTETIPTEHALHRILADTILAPHPLPPFRRSAVDGYAVRAQDTFGAASSLPAYLKLAGEVLMGTSSDLALAETEAAIVHTGGMIPEGADAVVMLEDTQRISEGEVEVLKPAAPGQYVLLAGEDVQAGECVIETGRRIRAQEIGGLMALGITEIPVVVRPTVAILSTGDEVIPPDGDQRPGQVRDVNSYTLSALIERAGGAPVRYGIIPDQLETLQEAARRAHAAEDLVLITAGSSVSARDITARVIEGLGQPGILVHGVSIRPGKPTILAICDGVPVIGLPGNPVSALVIGGLFVVPVLRRLLGMSEGIWRATTSAELSANVPSETGREDYIPVRLEAHPEGPLAVPIRGPSNLIFILVRADGLVRIPSEATGLERGEKVQVLPF